MAFHVPKELPTSGPHVVLLFKLLVFCSKDQSYHSGLSEVYLPVSHFSGVQLALINICRALLRFLRETATEVQSIIINLKLFHL